MVAILALGAALPPLEAQKNPVRENPKDGLKYVWIPLGSFMMGCSTGDNECANDEKPAHRVTITRGFWMGQTPVTVGAFKRFTQSRGRPMPPEPQFIHRPLNNGWTNQAMPIVNVTWDEARDYCAWVGSRLPTEAEWEYAARAGTNEARYGPLDDIAWYADNSGRERLDSARIRRDDPGNYAQRLDETGDVMHDVGQKRPNGFGLSDILGNAWEWVGDWYDPNYYVHSPSADPPGPADGMVHVLRGGAWSVTPDMVRVSFRNKINAAYRNVNFGFRCGGGVGSP
jgi:formylglycine-generating enzyme required for sulfatase activity